MKKPNCSCAFCDKKMYKKPYILKHNKFNYCSRECLGEHRKKYKNCERCGKSYNPKRQNQRFCSKSCAAKNIRNTGIGANLTIIDKITNLGWNKKCMIQGCHYNNVLESHRIIHGKDGGKYTTDNVAVICPNHHAEIHRLNKEIIKIKEFKFQLK